MALYSELGVYKNTYELAQKIFKETQDFKREYKYTLGQDMKRDVLQLTRIIYQANKYKQERKKYLENFLDAFELLKLEIRLCADMKLLTIKNHAEFIELMDKIGKQIVGWRNATPA